MSSIGKLAAVVERKALGAQVQRRELLEGQYNDPAFALVSLMLNMADLDDELDDIKIQNALRDTLISSVPARRGAKPSMAEYAASQLQSLDGRRVMRHLFIDLAQRLVDGYALDTESLVDVLTLKGNFVTSSADPVIALEKLCRDTVRSHFLNLLRG